MELEVCKQLKTLFKSPLGMSQKKKKATEQTTLGSIVMRHFPVFSIHNPV